MVSGVRRKWSLPGSSHVDDSHAILGGPDQECIALVLYVPREHGVCWADARLIAAAPELLDGINAVLGLLQLVAGRDDINPDVRAALTESHRIDEARAAVAKARGR